MPTVFFAIVALLITLSPSAHAATAQAVHEQAVKAIAAEGAAQAQYQQWSEDKLSMAADIRDMKAMEAWLEFQIRKYEKYTRKQETVIAELERRKEEAKRIQMELEPFLEKVVAELDQFVAGDMPFLAEERAARIRFLRESLDDYHIELSEKLRRVFEALLVETEYGRTVSTTTEELVISDEPTQVSLFRLGRTALFYQTADGSEAGMWDAASNAWRPLDPIFARTLQRARDMADRKRAVELLELPMGATR